MAIKSPLNNRKRVNSRPITPRSRNSSRGKGEESNVRTNVLQPNKAVPKSNHRPSQSFGGTSSSISAITERIEKILREDLKRGATRGTVGTPKRVNNTSSVNNSRMFTPKTTTQ